jgi:hypothetical protein
MTRRAISDRLYPVDAVKSLNPAHPIGNVLDKVLVGVVRVQALFGRAK